MAKKLQLLGSVQVPPEVTKEDNGKVMTVVNGKWVAAEPNVIEGGDAPDIITDQDIEKLFK